MPSRDSRVDGLINAFTLVLTLTWEGEICDTLMADTGDDFTSNELVNQEAHMEAEGNQ